MRPAAFNCHRSFSWWAATCLIVLISGSLAAQESTEGSTSASPEAQSSDGAGESERRSVIGIVDDVQADASRHFNDFIVQVDDFFGSGSEGEFENRSWARIRLKASQPGDEDLKVGGTVKLRVILPRAEQRFRLLLSSEDEDSTVRDPGNVGRLASEDDEVSLALRFIRSARSNSSTNFDLGVRQRDDAIQVFGRINANVQGEMARYWYGKASNSYFYYSKSGYENRLRFEARRMLLEKKWLFFSGSTGFDWEKGLKGASISQGLGIYAEISKRKQVALEALAGYATSLNEGNGARFRGTEVRIRWRHNIWRPWFFYEVWPSVSWPSSNDYERAYGGLIRIEVVIGSVK